MHSLFATLHLEPTNSKLVPLQPRTPIDASPRSTRYALKDGSTQKDDSRDTFRKMNPPWTFQSKSSAPAYNCYNTWPAHYQDAFSRGRSSGGPNQPPPVDANSGYERTGYENEHFRYMYQQDIYGGANDERFDTGTAPTWQRPRMDTYRPIYSESQQAQHREQADTYRPGYSRSQDMWQPQQQADTYRPIYTRPPPPWERKPADNHGEWRGEAVYSTASPGQQTGFAFEQRNYPGQQYQYAPSPFPYQQFPQFAMLHNAVIQELMPQWQSGNNIPANTFTPINSANPPLLDPSAQPFIPHHHAAPTGQQLQSRRPPQDDASPSGIEVPLDPRYITRSQRRQNRQAAKDPQAQPDLALHSIPFRPGWFRGAEKQHVMNRPVPTERYLEKAGKEPQLLTAGRPLLVVLDLNGTLIHRPPRKSTRFRARPKVDEFLHYLFIEHHVLIWSSVMPANLDILARKLLSKAQLDRLIGCWARDKLQIPQKDFHGNVYVYKQLSWIWKDEQIIAANPDPIDIWCQENTVLIEDSVDKTVSEPFNAILVEEFKGEKEQMESDVLGQVVRYLETLKYQSDVSAYIKSKPFKYDEEAAPFDWMPIVNDMH